MPYVTRDAEGRVVQEFDPPVTGAAEQMAAASKALRRIRFEHTANTTQALRGRLAETGYGMACFAKDLIKLTEFPLAAGARHFERVSLVHAWMR